MHDKCFSGISRFADFTNSRPILLDCFVKLSRIGRNHPQPDPFWQGEPRRRAVCEGKELLLWIDMSAAEVIENFEEVNIPLSSIRGSEIYGQMKMLFSEFTVLLH